MEKASEINLSYEAKLGSIMSTVRYGTVLAHSLSKTMARVPSPDWVLVVGFPLGVNKFTRMRVQFSSETDSCSKVDLVRD